MPKQREEQHWLEMEDHIHPWSGTSKLLASDIIAGKYDRQIALRNLRMAKSMSGPLVLDLVKTGAGGGRGRRPAAGRIGGHANLARRAQSVSHEKVARVGNRVVARLRTPSTSGEADHLQFRAQQSPGGGHLSAHGANGGGYSVLKLGSGRFRTRWHPDVEDAHTRSNLGETSVISTGGTTRSGLGVHSTRNEAIEAALQHHNRVLRRDRLQANRAQRPSPSSRRAAGSLIVTPQGHQLHHQLMAEARAGKLDYTGHKGRDYDYDNLSPRQREDKAHSVIRDIFPTHANMDWLHKMYGVPEGYKLKFKHVSPDKYDDSSTLSLEASILTANGQPLSRNDMYGDGGGVINRDITKSRHEFNVHHSYMRVPPAHSGRGFGHNMMREGIRSYREMGVKTVDVDATNLGGTSKSHGPLAWARYFDFKDHEREGVIDHFRNWVAKEYGPSGGRHTVRDRWGYPISGTRSEHGRAVFTAAEIGEMVSKIHHPWDIAALEDKKVPEFPVDVFNHPNILKHYDRRFPKGEFRKVMSKGFGRRFLMGEAGGTSRWEGIINLEDRNDPAIRFMRESKVIP